MERTTKQDAYAAFARLVRAVLGTEATSYWDVGGYQLDYNRYGGYRIEKIVSETGGVTCPFGYVRMPARAFVQAARMAEDAVRMAREPHATT